MSILWGLVVAVVSAVVSAVLTANLALRRFYSERWWERKAAAYAELIDALFRLYDLPVAWLGVELGTSKVLSDGEEAELMERYEAANRLVGKTLAVGDFVISKRAVEIVLDLRRRQVQEQVAAEQAGTGTQGLLQGAARAAKQTLEALRVEARRDLRVDREAWKLVKVTPPWAAGHVKGNVP